MKCKYCFVCRAGWPGSGSRRQAGQCGVYLLISWRDTDLLTGRRPGLLVTRRGVTTQLSASLSTRGSRRTGDARLPEGEEGAGRQALH